MELDHPPGLDGISDHNSSHPPSPSASTTDPSNHNSTPIIPAIIPDSVRGAPEELKPAIRKKQNKESARRSRRRRKELVLNLSHSIAMLVEKTQELEARIDSVESFLSKSGFEAFTQPRLQYPMLSGSSDAGPSNSGSIGLGSDGGSQSRQGSRSVGSVPKHTDKKELDDEDVEKLIASCLEQL